MQNKLPASVGTVYVGERASQIGSEGGVRPLLTSLKKYKKHVT